MLRFGGLPKPPAKADSDDIVAQKSQKAFLLHTLGVQAGLKPVGRCI